MEVGQELYLVYHDRRFNNNRYVTVEKVGRKWASIGMCGRIDIETLALDGGQYSSRGRCYLTKEEYEEKAAADYAWGRLDQAIGKQRRPKDIGVNEIKAAAALLGIARSEFD